MNQQQNQQGPIPFPQGKFQPMPNKGTAPAFGQLPSAGTGQQSGTGQQFGFQNQTPPIQFGNIQQTSQSQPQQFKPQQGQTAPLQFNPPQQLPNQPFPPAQNNAAAPMFQNNANFALKPTGQQQGFQMPQGSQNTNTFPKGNPFPGQPTTNFIQPKFPIQPNPSFPQQQQQQQQQQQKYDRMEVKNEYDKKQLVEKFQQYIKEGNLYCTIECMKQILENDIRVKLKD